MAKIGRLREFAKQQPKNKTKSYPWKVDEDTYEKFKEYCYELNFSINEGLTKLVELELEDYKPKRKKKRASRKTAAKRKQEKQSEVKEADEEVASAAAVEDEK